MLLILFFIISLLPAVFLFIWLKNRKKDDLTYKNICINAFKKGLFLSPIVTLGFCACFYILEIILKLIGIGELALEIYHVFILVAFSEELAKYLVFKSLIKKNSYNYSYLDLLSLLVVIGLGFEIIEACIYAVGADVATMMIRGLTIMHGSYQFIMAMFYCGNLKHKKKGTFVFGFILTVFVHGSYDFCLHDIAANINDNLIYVSLALAFISIFLIIYMIIYINKRKNNVDYNEPILINDGETN